MRTYAAGEHESTSCTEYTEDGSWSAASATIFSCTGGGGEEADCDLLTSLSITGASVPQVLSLLALLVYKSTDTDVVVGAAVAAADGGAQETGEHERTSCTEYTLTYADVC